LAFFSFSFSFSFSFRKSFVTQEFWEPQVPPFLLSCQQFPLAWLPGTCISLRAPFFMVGDGKNLATKRRKEEKRVEIEHQLVYCSSKECGDRLHQHNVL